MTALLGMPLSAIEAVYDAVVVGSGYGGGIAACRLARAGFSVAVLERGREWPSTSFPNDLASAARSVAVRGRAAGREIAIGARSALFDLHVCEDVSALTGRGLGGTSLINASAYLEPDPRVFDDPVWPRALRDDRAGLHAGAAAATAMLEPKSYPAGEPGFPSLAKAAFVRDAASSLDGVSTRPPLLTYFGPDRETEAGVSERACNGCGDCVSGCANEAKRTVDRTYIADARAHGAHVFCEIDVRSVARSGAMWRVHLRPETAPIEPNLPDPFILARRVFIAGGVFGSTALLFRSREHGLALSDALGTQVSANGNRILAVEGVRPPDAERRAGPCITEAARTNAGDLEDSFTVEDGGIPCALATFVALSATRSELSRNKASGVLSRIAVSARTLAASAAEEIVGAARPLQVLLVQAHDDAAGRLSFDRARGDVSLEWPRFGEGIRTEDAETTLDEAARSAGGRARPLGIPLPGKNGPITVHPLGGCPMGDDRDVGVVDHLGRVFDAGAADRTSVHDGLFVVDGSIIPRSLGTNPVWSICALAERAMTHAIDTTPRPRRARAPTFTPSSATGAAFSEAFSGWVKEDERALGALNSAGDLTPLVEPVELRLVITVDDVEGFLRDPIHPAHAIGTLRCSLLGPRPLSVLGGKIALFSDDPVRQHTYYETYELHLLAEDGARFELRALKTFTDGSPIRVYGDGTHLPISITGAKRHLTGALTMPATKLLATVAGVTTHRAKGTFDQITAGAKFRAFFARRWFERIRFSEERR